MKTVIYMRCITVFAALSLALASSPLMAQVYKVVDKDGNVTFTDQPPADGSKPIELAPISVIEAPEYEKAPASTDEEDAQKEPSLSDLRRVYRDFAIIAPEQEQSVWKPDGPIAVAWNVSTALQPGMEVTLFLDGNRHTTTVQPMIPLSGLDRGEHTVKAELRDSKNRIVATAQPVVFYVRQPNLYNRPRINPGGG